MVHSARSSARRKLSATASAPKLWALMNEKISHFCTSIQKVLDRVHNLIYCISKINQNYKSRQKYQQLANVVISSINHHFSNMKMCVFVNLIHGVLQLLQSLINPGVKESGSLTSSFSFPPDSEEERIAVETASRYGSKPDIYCAPAAEDVHVEVKIDGEGPKMGCDAKLSIVLKNLSSEPRRTTLHSQAAVMHYTGVLKNAIKKDQIPIELLPNEGLIFFIVFFYMFRIIYD